MVGPRDIDQQESHDAHLIVGIRSGDRSALETIYKLYARDLISFARSYFPVGTAEDVVQDVFVSLWERSHKLNVQSSLRGYLFGSVKRRARDIKRHYKVQDRVASQLAPNESPALGTFSESPLSATQRRELDEALDEILSSLDEDHRTLLTLRWIYGMTYEEAGEVLGISTNAAKKQGQRLDQKLRPLFEKFR